MAENRMYNVKNRSASICIYDVPELHITRQFAPGETKKIAGNELEKLMYQPGGKSMVLNYLQVEDIESLENLGTTVEPEYNMSEKDIVKLIAEGSLDEFLDTLDFAPDGVIDLIKEIAISLPMNDANKRKALKDKTGYDVEAVLRHLEEEKAELTGDAPVEEAPKQRRTKAAATTATKTRRTAPKKYETKEN